MKSTLSGLKGAAVVGWALAGGLAGNPLALAGAESRFSGSGPRPNVLFLLIDDHAAHMTSVLGESVVRTPAMERLAARGAWFTRAYNVAPSCAPSRAAFLTGVHPAKSGVYYNSQGMRRTKAPIAKARTLQQLFLAHGYLVAGYGKIEHTGYQQDERDAYTPGYRVMHRDRQHTTHQESDLWRHVLPGSLRWPDPGYAPTRFGMLPDDWDRDDPKKLREDTEHANRTIAFLRQRHERPFFLSCGFWAPHSERIVAKRYFDQYPLEQIEIPRSYLAGDLEDVPVAGRWRATKRGTHAAVVNAGLWREYLRSYYAATSYVDEQLGRVLAALESGPNSSDTIVIFASDNGYNAGEKDMWAKFALWEQTNRVVFSIGVPGVPPRMVHSPVGLIDLYPTLLTLCGLPAPREQTLDGVDLTPLIRGTRSERGRPVLSTWGEGNHSIRDARFRYLRYRNGDEEFYDHAKDPYEWHNRAQDPAYVPAKRELARWLPQADAPEIEPARPWDGSELRADLFEKWARGEVPVADYDRNFR